MLKKSLLVQRPLLHFSSPENWLNDPNGLVYYKGFYHLFYQHNPYDSRWGQIHWGHAVSSDTLNWESKDIAIYPNSSLSDIFSGCGVIDTKNTSGFFETGEGIVLIFTGVSIDKATANRFKINILVI